MTLADHSPDDIPTLDLKLSTTTVRFDPPCHNRHPTSKLYAPVESVVEFDYRGVSEGRKQSLWPTVIWNDPCSR